MNIYQISQELTNILNILEYEELTPEIEAQLIISQSNLQNKAVDYGYAVKSLQAESDAISEEIKRLQGEKKKRENIIDRLKDIVKQKMIEFNIESVKTPTINISIRNNPESVEVLNEIQVDRRYWNEKVVWSLDKAAVKKAIQSGEAVKGCVLIRTQSIQIK
jgi:hypothetical protein